MVARIVLKAVLLSLLAVTGGFARYRRRLEDGPEKEEPWGVCGPIGGEMEQEAERKAEEVAEGRYDSWEEVGIDITTGCFDVWYSKITTLFKEDKGDKYVEDCALNTDHCYEVGKVLREYREDLWGDGPVHNAIRESKNTVDFRTLICAWYFGVRRQEAYCIRGDY